MKREMVRLYELIEIVLSDPATKAHGSGAVALFHLSEMSKEHAKKRSTSVAQAKER